MNVLRSSTLGSVAASNGVWVLGDDGIYYHFIVSGGIWTNDKTSSVVPDATRNFSGQAVGTAVYIGGHQFVMAQSGAENIYIWQDTGNSLSGAIAVTVSDARFDHGLNIIDVDGYQIHKMMPLSGIWSEANQGNSLPL